MEVREGSLYEPVAKERFDFICVHPPYVALPAGFGGAPFADGGPDGMRLLGPILEGLKDHLAPRGQAMLYVQGLGGPSGPFFATHLAEIAARRSLEGQLLLLDRKSIADTLRAWGDASTDPQRWATRRRGLLAHFRAGGASAYYAMLATLRRGRGGISIVDAVPRRR